MSSTVFRDLGTTFKDLLKDVSGLPGESAIEFKSPADMESLPSSPKLSIYLYQTLVNSHLRNIPPTPVNYDKMKYPPLTLDLHFLFTPYAQDRDAELMILEGVMQKFHDVAVLKGDLLKGNLYSSGNEEIRIVPDTLTLDDLNKLWSTFPNKAYKVSASYKVTPVAVPSAKPDKDIVRVVETDVRVMTKKKKGQE